MSEVNKIGQVLRGTELLAALGNYRVEQRLDNGAPNNLGIQAPAPTAPDFRPT